MRSDVRATLDGATIAGSFDYGYGAPAVLLIYGVVALAAGVAIGVRAGRASDHRHALLLVVVLLLAWFIQIVLGVDAFAAALVLVLAAFALPIGYGLAVWRTQGPRRRR